MNNGECIFIEKFYKTQQAEFKNYLFMDICSNSSLDFFRNRFQTTQSLNTRLFILYQIAMGIKYLKDN
jgi:serine/threonine protein kinase